MIAGRHRELTRGCKKSRGESAAKAEEREMEIDRESGKKRRERAFEIRGGRKGNITGVGESSE